MNGELLKQVKEVFNDIVMPHIENIKEDTKESKESIRSIYKKIDTLTTSIANNKISAETNKVNLKNITSSFRNYIIIATFILSAVAFVANLVAKIIK